MRLVTGIEKRLLIGGEHGCRIPANDLGDNSFG